MDEDSPYEGKRSSSPAAMSKVPSWISVGLVIGVLIGFAVQPAPKPPEVKIVEVVKNVPQPVRFPVAEAVFEAYRSFAAWRDDDTTEIALWNPDTKHYTDFFEVRRVGDLTYFRTIPHLTRQLIDYGSELPANAPIRFAGPEPRRAASKP
jgi:hypothetical protein